MESHQGIVRSYDASVKYFVQDVAFDLFDNSWIPLDKSDSNDKALFFKGKDNIEGRSVDEDYLSDRDIKCDVYRVSSSLSGELGFRERFYIKKNRYVADVIKYEYDKFVRNQKANPFSRFNFFSRMISSNNLPKGLADYADRKIFSIKQKYVTKLLIENQYLDTLAMSNDDVMKIAAAYVDTYPIVHHDDNGQEIESERKDMFSTAVAIVNDCSSQDTATKEKECMNYIVSSIYLSNGEPVPCGYINQSTPCLSDHSQV